MKNPVTDMHGVFTRSRPGPMPLGFGPSGDDITRRSDGMTRAHRWPRLLACVLALTLGVGLGALVGCGSGLHDRQAAEAAEAAQVAGKIAEGPAAGPTSAPAQASGASTARNPQELSADAQRELAAGPQHSRDPEASTDSEGPKAITLDSDAQQRLGVGTTTLEAVTAPTGIATTARVLDPSPLLQLDSELTAAVASLTASRAEADRTRKLYAEDRTASAKALEAANAQAQADQQRVFSAQRRLALEWGDGVASLPEARRAVLLDDLAHVRAELIRVEMPPNTGIPERGAVLGVRSTAESPVLRAVVLGYLPAADPRLQTRGILAELKGPEAALPIGQMAAAEIPTRASSVSGVVLPRAALLRKDSQVWAYVQTAPTTFLRKEVLEYRPVLSGWFVEKGFAPGERVVTAGAAALLAVETPTADSD